MSKNFDLFWVTAVPLGILVLCMSRMWTSIFSKLQKKMSARMFSEDFAKSVLQKGLVKAVQAFNLIKQAIRIGRQITGQRATSGLGNRQFNPGVSTV